MDEQCDVTVCHDCEIKQPWNTKLIIWTKYWEWRCSRDTFQPLWGELPPALPSCNPRPLISLSILFVSIFQPLLNLQMKLCGLPTLIASRKSVCRKKQTCISGYDLPNFLRFGDPSCIWLPCSSSTQLIPFFAFIYPSKLKSISCAQSRHSCFLSASETESVRKKRL